jgi:nicotinate-nucleotide pyrophosphorylase (carboxylating)
MKRTVYHSPMFRNNPQVLRIIDMALDEDLGTGDVTTDAVVPADARVTGEVVAKEDGVLAGLPVALLVLERVDPAIRAVALAADGDLVHRGQPVLRLEGPAAAVLVAERPLLNFVMRLSGIATTTRAFVAALEGTRTTVLDTRKTTPGLRVLEKYAVRVGGARNHRMTLAGGVLVKNNHIAVRGGDLKAAVREAREKAPALCRIEVEVRTMDEVKQALEAGADVLLLDHMTLDEAAQVVDFCHWKVQLEVSGNMTPESARAAAQVGVDFVSAGALTHSARWMDFAMYLQPVAAPEPPRAGA